MAWDDIHCDHRRTESAIEGAGDMGPEKAAKILQTDKQQAKSLMVVNRIRHDIGTTSTMPQRRSSSVWKNIIVFISL